MSSEVLPPTTDAATVTIQVDATGEHVTVAASGLVGEVVPIEYDAGGTFVPSGYELSSSEAAQVIVGAGTWRLSKPSTGAPVGIYVSGAGMQRITVA